MVICSAEIPSITKETDERYKYISQKRPSIPPGNSTRSEGGRRHNLLLASSQASQASIVPVRHVSEKTPKLIFAHETSTDRAAKIFASSPFRYRRHFEVLRSPRQAKAAIPRTRLVLGGISGTAKQYINT